MEGEEEVCLLKVALGPLYTHWVGKQSVIYLAWRGSEVKSTPMLQSKSNAPYLNRNNSYLYRLARHFGSNWREYSRWFK
jgi:hypothetical protein